MEELNNLMIRKYEIKLIKKKNIKNDEKDRHKNNISF